MRQIFVVAAVLAIGWSARPVHAEIATGPLEQMRSFEPGPVFLTAAQRRTRAELIRDTAAAAGMTNAALLAGIGEVETNFAHCWSEATWACQGPASSSCDGGPVIAGASDGACSLQQGGLGMFQFDSGTFSQTIATYGPDIVTMQGNVNAVIPFLVTRAIQSVDGITSEADALAWMNSIEIRDGDAQYEEWLYFVAWRYNGCMGCTTQINKYRNGTNKLRDEFGPDFWGAMPVPETCAPITTAGRTIEETDDCFHKRGTASSWYAGDRGMSGACLFTYTTDDPAPDNQASWELQFEADGRYRVEVYTDGGVLGQSRKARYVVTHAGGTADVVIDQTAVDGFQSLGEFEFTAGTAFAVSLADNTGEPYSATAKIGIMFDAVRVQPADGVDLDGDGEPDDAGGCAAGSNQAGSMLFALGLGLVVALRRRRARA
jgi:MYXO-CTERM domain-containing protein